MIVSDLFEQLCNKSDNIAVCYNCFPYLLTIWDEYVQTQLVNGLVADRLATSCEIFANVVS